MKVKLYIQAEKYNFEKEFRTCVNAFKIKSSQTHIVIDIAEVEVDVEVPDISQNDLTLAHIEQLKGVKKSIQADCNAKVTAIENQIANLLAITCEEGL